ncbi:oligosaccharide flippase family protein [Parabacteroides sp. APC149_11_2_Y6]
MFNNLISSVERSSIVKRNIIWSFIVKGVSIIITLIIVPMTLGYISSELYGVWLTLSSIVIWFGFFDIGFTLGLKNKLAEAIALKDWNKGKSLISTTYFLMLLIFIPLFIFLEIILPFLNISSFINVDYLYNYDIIRACRILILFFCLQMILNVVISVIAAFQRVALSSALYVIGNICSLLTIYIFTNTTVPSLSLLAIAISGMPVIVLLVATFILYSNKLKSVRPSIIYIDKKYIKELLPLGFKFFLIQIQYVVLFQTTNILISNISGPKDVTAYNLAYKYISGVMMVYTIILSPLWPAFTDAYVKKDYVWMRNVYKKMTKIYYISIIIVVVMVLISPLFYNLWISNKVEVPLSMTVTVAMYIIICNWDNLQVNLINGIGTIKLQSYITTIGLILHVPLSFLLGRNIGIGATGVILSMIIINIIYSVFFTIQINKLLHDKAEGIWRK